ncbi:hypothetical protein BH10PSE2_BH10PSE2_23170 [soil metagenome]
MQSTPGALALRGSLSLRDGLVHIFYNAKLIFIGLAVGLAGGLAAAIASPPQYTAESLLLLRVGATEAAQQGLNGPLAFQGAEAVQRVLQSDAEVIRSQPVVLAALDRVEGRSASAGLRRGSPAPSGKTLARFQKALRVEVEPNSNLIRVSFHSPDRARALAAVAAVVEAYSAQRAGLYINGAQARQDQEIDRYAGALDVTEADIQTVRSEHDVLDVDTDVKLASNRLDTLNQRTSQARERLGVVEAELGATVRSLAEAPARLLDSQERTNSTPNDEARNTLLRLRQDRAHLVEQYAADWPGLAEVDARIGAAQTQIVENAQDIRSSDRTIRNPVSDLLDSRRAGLVVEQASLRRQIAELTGQIAVAEARMATLRDAEMRLHDLERSRTASETIYRTLLIGRAGSTLEDQAVDDHTASLRVVQPATASARPKSLRAALAIAGLFAGIACAIVAALIATLLRQTYITPGEAEQSLALAAVQTFDLEEADPRTPRGQAAIRRLASLMGTFGIDRDPTQVLQLVGDSPDKSRLGLALAQALTQMQAMGAGAPVLLIDFDAADHFARKAGREAVRRLPVGPGHLDVARSATPGLWAAVASEGVPLDEAGLSVLRGAFARIVIVARRAFDDPDARRLYPLADLNLILITAERTRAPVARRIREEVLTSGGDLLGFVFTRRRFHIPEAIHRWL